MQIEQLKEEECLKILKLKQLGRIACSYNDQPYIVPLNFVFDGDKYLYASSVIGQKITWMRKNPLVCIEVDQIDGQNDWKTVVVYGKFEELPNTSEFADLRDFAGEILSKYPVGEQLPDRTGKDKTIPENNTIFYRISIEKMTGHRKSQAMRAMYFENSDVMAPSRGRAWGCDKLL
jgi:nitroimidazol reductase NimA-like FMN-containing flavoprotein (pyridoxamine 5'-phosphate oxidase superfamily)